MKKWQRVVRLVALVVAATASCFVALYGLMRLDEVAGFSLTAISTWCPFGGVDYAGLWSGATGTAASSIIAVHVVLDVFVMISYAAAFLLLGGWIRSHWRVFGWILHGLLGAALVFDVVEDVLLGTAAALLARNETVASLMGGLELVTPLKWLAFLPLLAATVLGGIVLGIVIFVRWRSALRRAASS